MSAGFREKVSQSSGGCSCGFYEVGLKLYHDEEDRDEAFLRQQHAHAHGIAPFAVAKLEVDGQPALLTELVDMVREYPGDGAVRDAEMRHEEVFGFKCGDFHAGNMGLVDEKIVFIDFGYHGYRSNERRLGAPWLEGQE